MTNEIIYSIENLRVEVGVGGGTIPIVDGVSLYIRQSEALGLVGESGAGKSILAMAMIGMPPQPNGRIAGGRVSFHGLDMLNRREARAVVGKRIGFIFEDSAASLDPCYTIGAQIIETIVAHEDIHKAAARERALELLSLVGIADPPSAYTAYPHQFSGGMQQRAMFAIALSCRPEFLIGDNPTSALDVTIQAQILRLINDLRKRLGLTVFWITNNFGVVAKLCDRVAVMYAGTILEIGKVRDVLRNPVHPYTRRLLASSGIPSARSGPSLAARAGAVSANGEVGCRFATQCPTVMTTCSAAPIAMSDLGAGHLTRCLLVSKAS